MFSIHSALKKKKYQDSHENNIAYGFKKYTDDKKS